MRPRQSLRLNKRQEAAYRRVHSILAKPPRQSRMAALMALLGVR